MNLTDLGHGFILVVAIALLGSGVFAEEPAASQELIMDQQDREIYFCPDEKSPCLGDTADVCGTCPVDLKKSAYSLKGHMQVLSLLTKPLKTDINEQNYDLLKRRNDLIQAVANRIPEFRPKKNVEQLEAFIKQAGELAQYSLELAKAITAKDEAGLKTQSKAITDSCSGCHRAYR